MKRFGPCVILAAALCLAIPVIADARPGGGHGGGGARHGGGYRGGHGHGHYHGHYRPYYGYGAAAVFFGASYYAYPYYPYYYPAPAYYAPAPAYIEQPQAAPESSGYWYYCQAPQGYYPQVQSCPGGWQQVPPQPPPR